MSVKPGKRNAALLKMASHLRRCGLQRNAINAALIALNEEQCKPPLPQGEVAGIADYISKYEPGDVKE